MDKILTFNGKIATGGGRWITRAGSTPDPYNPLGLPPYTIRVQFEDASFNPATSGISFKSGATWTQVSSSPNVWDYTRVAQDNSWEREFYNRLTQLNIGGTYSVLGANTTGLTNMRGMFWNNDTLTSVPLFDLSSATDIIEMFCFCTSLITVPQFNTSSVTIAAGLFDGCTNLASVPLLDLSHAYRTESMFKDCSSLRSVPLYDLSSSTTTDSMFRNCSALETAPLFNLSRVRDAEYMFAGCSSIQSVPLYNLSSAVQTSNMFAGCYNVESGALALYNQVSTQANPPTGHTDMFYDCGLSTVSGRAELAQIPDDWK